MTKTSKMVGKKTLTTTTQSSSRLTFFLNRISGKIFYPERFQRTLTYFVINAKNYLEIGGARLADFARSASEVAREPAFQSLQFFLAPPNFGLYALANASDPSLRLLAQHLDLSRPGAATGYSVPEIAKSYGAIGSIINHSEHRIPREEISQLVLRLRSLSMISLVCAKDDVEVETFAKLSPDFIAVEPPDLIGSGKAVSKERPEIIMDSKKSLERGRPAGSQTRLLCGAGIVDGADARRSVELGAEGILVASGVVKASEWKAKISELASGLNDAQKPKAR